MKENIYSLYQSCKTEWERNRATWQDIARYVGITVDVDYQNTAGNGSKKGKDADVHVDDPTAALAVTQAGDYIMGVMWGTGDRVLDITPSRYVTELVDKAAVEDWFAFATEQALYHMNHPDAGLSTAMQPYSHDQQAFGTSGIGVFRNKSFLDGVSENALVFSNYGVDNLLIDEGKGGQCDVVFVVYQWKVNRIIGEFGKVDGEVTDEGLSKLPKPIVDAWKNKDFNRVFKLVFGFYPREDYDPKLLGKRGAKYQGVWFMDDSNDHRIFFTEDFMERPIAVARAIKIRGEIYGRASGTLLNSTIKGVNFMVGTAIDIVEKMSNPSLGLFSNAIFGDSVLDTSPNGMTVFNQQYAQGVGNPIFPLYDVGDPSAILQFLVPYLNEKITTGFKVDALLDFASAREMTATESLQRYAIRGKSLAGILIRQKNEMLVPITKRSISLLMELGELGVRPDDRKSVERLSGIGQQRRVIPAEVLEVMKAGKPWYDIKWNNELEKLTRTEAIQSLLQLLQAISAIAGMYPEIIMAIDWYKLLSDINSNLDANNQIMFSADEFRAQVQAMAQQKQQMMALQAGDMAAKAGKNMAEGKKADREAQQ